MTQILSVMTTDYVLLASDRRVTYGEGPKIGEVADEDTCKLVNLCSTTGIAYSGVGIIRGVPTHQWIAKTWLTPPVGTLRARVAYFKKTLRLPLLVSRGRSVVNRFCWLGGASLARQQPFARIFAL